MEHKQAERRKEPRYPIEAKALVRRKSGETIHATAVDISSSGMLLHIEPPFLLNLEEEVTVEVELPQDPDKPFSSWGVGRVAHIDGHRTGIQLCAGNFDLAQPLDADKCRADDITEIRNSSLNSQRTQP